MVKKTLILMATCALFIGCTKKPAATVQKAVAENDSIESVTITLGFSTNMEDPRGVASQLFKDEVEQNSYGRIKIDIHANGELGSDSELIEGVINFKNSDAFKIPKCDFKNI